MGGKRAPKSVFVFFVFQGKGLNIHLFYGLVLFCPALQGGAVHPGRSLMESVVHLSASAETDRMKSHAYTKHGTEVE